MKQKIFIIDLNILVYILLINIQFCMAEFPIWTYI